MIPIVLSDYSLPDISILSPDSGESYYLWQPDQLYIVLGRSNNVRDALNVQAVLNDNVKVMQRPTGGESVILSPRMIVFSTKFAHKMSKAPLEYFKLINKHLISYLTKLGVKNLSSKGISDLSIGEKKIMGSSMNLKENTLFYHAVLNVSEEISLLSKYLKHPSREPDYRKGRSHDEFVTSLFKEGYKIENQVITNHISKALEEILEEVALIK